MKKRFSFLKFRTLLLVYITVVLAFGVNEAVNNGSMLSGVAARYVDKTLPHKKSDTKDRLIGGAKARLVSIFVYPIYAAADASYFFLSAGFEYSRSLTGKEPQASLSLCLAKKNIEMAKRCLTGLVAFPLGVFSGDYVTRHFVEDQPLSGVIESGGQLYTAEGEMIYPESINQIQELVRFARDNDRKISIVGAGLSQGKHYLPGDSDDLVLNLKLLQRVQVDKDIKTAIVQAGATWRDVQEAINPYGLSIQVMQASNIFSVGGSLSANCHGWDHRAGSIANTVKSLTIVDADGDIRKVVPVDEEFGTILGGYGLFGVIVEVELQLTDNIELIDTGEEVAIDEYVRYFKDEVLSNDSIKLHLYRLSLNPDALLSEGVVQNYIASGASTNLPLVSDLHDEPYNGRLIERVGVHSGRKFPIIRKKFWEQEKERIKRPVETTRNEVMRAPIHAMLNNSRHDTEWLQEFFLPGEELSSYLKELGGLLTRYNVPLINASVRYIEADPNIILGYNRGGDRFAVVLCFNQPLEDREIEHTREWVKQAIDLTINHNGTYYLPYQHFASEEQFKQAYPFFNEFVSAKNKFDPNGIFGSQFYDYHLALMYTENSEDIDEAYSDIENSYEAFKKVFASNEKRREFRKFLRNIFLNLNEDDYMKLVEKTLENAMSESELYNSLAENIGEATPNVLFNSWRTLKALKDQKRVLKQQLAELIDRGTAIDGYVEIGFPGRMTNVIKEIYDVTGSTYVVNNEESILDYLQSGFPRPYDHFVALDDYAALTANIDAESVDLVTCLIGLHHSPEENLDVFVKSISEILRPGGSFILRDHDASNLEFKAMAYLAHSTFNLGTGVPWSGIGGGYDESTEVRNFQGLDYWDTLLARHGLIRDKSKSPIYRPGDPTRNALVRYVKVDSGKPSFMNQNSEGDRMQLQTFMTAVEWHSVRVAREYADFTEHTPFYLYPYFEQIKVFWQLFGQSWSEARRYNSMWEVITSDYFLMNGFITLFHTLEFTAKGLISWPIAFMYQSEGNIEPDTISVIIIDPANSIASFKSRGVEVINELSQNLPVFEIRMPRYMQFRELMIDMLDKGVQVLKVAGQKRIQVQCTLPTADLHKVESIAGSRIVGVYTKPLEPNLSVAYLNVEICKLHTILPMLKEQGVAIDYIHDF